MEETKAIDGIDWEIEEGKFYVVCGKSGCGKSTLLRHFKTALWQKGTREGEIFYQGKPLEQILEKKQSREIGYVFQDPDKQIVTDKVWHELAFAMESLGFDKDVMEIRMGEMASYFGIENWFQKEVDQLSGGQKQLLNLASVMALNPKILILDEPTSQLDPIGANSFLETLHRINEELGVTIILSEHHLDQVIGWADEVVVLEKGKIFAQGTGREIGEQLRKKDHEMFLAMPAPMRIYACTTSVEKCPCTVREGRKWLAGEMEKRNSAEEFQEFISWKAGTLGESPKGKNRGDRRKETVISLKNVWFRYDKNDRDILQGVTASVNSGEIFALMGGNGSGKSTTLNLIGGILRPYEGKILIKGKNLRNYKAGELYGKILGVLPQNPQSVFAKKTVEEDLLQMVSKESRVYQEVISLLHLAPLLYRHPYDLSGGEQQRAALAKVLMAEPEILLLDEPTKGMDAYGKKELGELLEALVQKGITIVMVSHDVEFCGEYARKVGLFFQGNIVTIQDREDFFCQNQFYTTVANRMARDYFPNAVTAEDVVYYIGHYVDTKPGFAKDCGLKEDNEEKKEEKRQIDRTDYAKAEEQYEATPPNKKESFGGTYRKFLGGYFAVGIFLFLPFVIWAGTTVFQDRQYLFMSLVIALYGLMPLLVSFEKGKHSATKLVVIGTMTAIAVMGRAAFFMVPSVKPMAAIAIIGGIGLGAESGFFIGALSMLVSNMLFGQGPWTPWQMVAMGIVGLGAGLLSSKWKGMTRRVGMCLYGFLAVLILYGGIMNPASLVMMSYGITKQNLVAIYLSGLPLDLVHAGSTAIFLFLGGVPILEKLDRIKKKYNGIDEDDRKGGEQDFIIFGMKNQEKEKGFSEK